jgi:endonuclease I
LPEKKGNIIVIKMKERKGTTGFLRLFIAALAILIVQNNYAQAPAGYYDSATGTGYTLKTQLYNIIKGHTVRSYDQLWTDFYSTDRKTNGYVWDIYSDKPGSTPAYDYTFFTEQCGNYSGEGSCYNREHSFPKSWFDDASPMYSELFHLYPTDGYVNGKRSNYPFGEVGTASWTSTNGSKLGTSNYPGYTGIVFEPIDEYKGDFARTYFYMATRYENIISGWENNDSNGDAVLNGTTDQVYEDWFLNLIIDWHNNDPVSQKEIDRNNAIYAKQNNRNPFIDHPEYVAKIWGGAVPNNPPGISSIILNPANPKSTDPVNVSATITDSDGTITSAVLKWGLVSGSLTNTINLTKTTGNTYSTVSAIPAQSDGVTVYYKIEATDDSSDVTITSQYSYTVNDNFYNVTIFGRNVYKLFNNMAG